MRWTRRGSSDLLIVAGLETAAGVARADEVAADRRVARRLLRGRGLRRRHGRRPHDRGHRGALRPVPGGAGGPARRVPTPSTRSSRTCRDEERFRADAASRSGARAIEASSASTPPRWPGPTGPSRLRATSSTGPAACSPPTTRRWPTATRPSPSRARWSTSPWPAERARRRGGRGGRAMSTSSTSGGPRPAGRAVGDRQHRDARAAREVIRHPTLELVGVLVYDPAKAGVDAGTLCGEDADRHRGDDGSRGDRGARARLRRCTCREAIDLDDVVALLEVGHEHRDDARRALRRRAAARRRGPRPRARRVRARRHVRVPHGQQPRLHHRRAPVRAAVDAAARRLVRDRGVRQPLAPRLAARCCSS